MTISLASLRTLESGKAVAAAPLTGESTISPNSIPSGRFCGIVTLELNPEYGFWNMTADADGAEAKANYPLNTTGKEDLEKLRKSTLLRFLSSVYVVGEDGVEQPGSLLERLDEGGDLAEYGEDIESLLNAIDPVNGWTCNMYFEVRAGCLSKDRKTGRNYKRSFITDCMPKEIYLELEKNGVEVADATSYDDEIAKEARAEASSATDNASASAKRPGASGTAAKRPSIGGAKRPPRPTA